MPGNYNRVTLQEKRQIFEAFESGVDYLQVARSLGIKRTTAWSIVQRAHRNDGQLAKPRGGARPRRQRITPELVAAAVNIVECHPKDTLDQINRRLAEVLPHEHTISRSTLARALNMQLLFSIRPPEIVPEGVDELAVKDSRMRFARWLLERRDDQHQGEFVFVDEVSVSLWTPRTRNGRHNLEAVRIVAGRRGGGAHNLTLTIAVSNQRGLLYHRIHRGDVNREQFEAFLRQLCVVILTQNLEDNGVDIKKEAVDQEKVSLLLDNLPAHHVTETMLPVGVDLAWLPGPSSPFLNIASSCLAQFKGEMRQRVAETRDRLLIESSHTVRLSMISDLAERLIEDLITTEGAATHFQELLSCLPSCLLDQEITV